MKIKKIALVAVCLVTLLTSMVIPMAADEPATAAGGLFDLDLIVFTGECTLLNPDLTEGYAYYEELLMVTQLGFEMPTFDEGFFPDLIESGEKRCIQASNVILCVDTIDGLTYCISVPKIYVYYVCDSDGERICWYGYDKSGNTDISVVYNSGEVGSDGSWYSWNPLCSFMGLCDRSGALVYPNANTKPSLAAIPNVSNVSVLFLGNSSIQDLSFNRCVNQCGFNLSNGQSYQQGRWDGENLGYDLGYGNGYDAGNLDGYLNGFSAGESSGYEAGSADGWFNGYDVGYDEGRELGYEDGLDEGYNAGYLDGHDVAYDSGYREGVLEGQTDALNSKGTLKELVFAIFEAPGRFIDGVLNFDLFGINLAGFVKTLITLAVVSLVLFLLIKLGRG